MKREKNPTLTHIFLFALCSMHSFRISLAHTHTILLILCCSKLTCSILFSISLFQRVCVCVHALIRYFSLILALLLLSINFRNIVPILASSNRLSRKILKIAFSIIFIFESMSFGVQEYNFSMKKDQCMELFATDFFYCHNDPSS